VIIGFNFKCHPSASFVISNHYLPLSIERRWRFRAKYADGAQSAHHY